MCPHPSGHGCDFESEESEDEETQHNIWNTMLQVFILQESSPILQDDLEDWEICRVGLSCRFALDVTYAITAWRDRRQEDLPV